MLYREIIAVCSQIHTKHINTLCRQNVGFVNVKLFGFTGLNEILIVKQLQQLTISYTDVAVTKKIYLLKFA